MSANDAVPAIDVDHTRAEQAVTERRSAGFDMKKLAIVAEIPHTEEHLVSSYKTGHRGGSCVKTGAFRGRMWGGTLGAGLFKDLSGAPEDPTEPVAAGPHEVPNSGEGRSGAVPLSGNSSKTRCGAKPFLIRPEVRAAPVALSRYLSGAPGDTPEPVAPGPSLKPDLEDGPSGPVPSYGIGLPKDSILKYEIAIKADRFLLLAHGAAEDTPTASETIRGAHPGELNTHPPKHAEADNTPDRRSRVGLRPVAK